MGPNSHDLNPIDYAVRGAFSNESINHRRKFNTVEELKRAEWQKLSHVIETSINEWRHHRECVVKNGGELDISNTAISLEL